jgi:CubicO group peptidase (beta-lactamase class C family)
MRVGRVIGLAALLSAAMHTVAPATLVADSRPAGIAWTQAKAGPSGINAAAIAELYDKVAHDTHHDLKGIVIMRDGTLVSERYFNGDSATTLHDIRSATKSITSLLMGLVVQQGLVHSVDDSIALYLPNLPRDGKEKITIKDLLNMRSGLCPVVALGRGNYVKRIQYELWTTAVPRYSPRYPRSNSIAAIRHRQQWVQERA